MSEDGKRAGATAGANTRPAPRIERVIVPLDAVSENRTAIDTAVRLAARAHAPLHGVFVEDEDLLNIALLPFTRQTTLGAEAEALTPEHVELHLRLMAERARQELFAAAARRGVAASFEIVRGGAAAAVAVASEGDLVVAGALSRPIGAHFRLACQWWSSIETARAPLLLARHGWDSATSAATANLGSVVILLRERSDAAGRLLDKAAQIAAAAGYRLTVICPPAVARTARFDGWIAERLGEHAVRLQIEIGPAEPQALYHRLAELGCRLVAVEAGLAEGGSERLRQLADHTACHILVVR